MMRQEMWDQVVRFHRAGLTGLPPREVVHLGTGKEVVLASGFSPEALAVALCEIATIARAETDYSARVDAVKRVYAALISSP